MRKRLAAGIAQHLLARERELTQGGIPAELPNEEIREVVSTELYRHNWPDDLDAWGCVVGLSRAGWLGWSETASAAEMWNVLECLDRRTWAAFGCYPHLHDGLRALDRLSNLPPGWVDYIALREHYPLPALCDEALDVLLAPLLVGSLGPREAAVWTDGATEMTAELQAAIERGCGAFEYQSLLAAVGMTPAAQVGLSRSFCATLDRLGAERMAGDFRVYVDWLQDVLEPVVIEDEELIDMPEPLTPNLALERRVADLERDVRSLRETNQSLATTVDLLLSMVPHIEEYEALRVRAPQLVAWFVLLREAIRRKLRGW